MNQEIVKTVKWSDAKELLSALANKNLGRAKNNKPADFNEFVTAYPTVTQKRMFDFLEGIVLRNSLSDVTSLAVIAEDSCLFSAEAVTAIDIVLRHLKTLCLLYTSCRRRRGNPATPVGHEKHCPLRQRARRGYVYPFKLWADAQQQRLFKL